jgi:hypothetical protein
MLGFGDWCGGRHSFIESGLDLNSCNIFNLADIDELPQRFDFHPKVTMLS